MHQIEIVCRVNYVVVVYQIAKQNTIIRKNKKQFWNVKSPTGNGESDHYLITTGCHLKRGDRF